MKQSVLQNSSDAAALPQSLEQQWQDFRSHPFLAMPIAGAIAWFGIAIAGLYFESVFARSMAVYFGTGMIFYLGLIVAWLMGEDLLGRNRPKNAFDRFFMAGVIQAVLVYAIAIPFALVQPDSLPMSVGILSGLMWIPFSVLIGHWLGFFHAGARTAWILVLWYLWPEWRFVSIPLAIVVVYILTILLLRNRYRALATASR